MAGPVSSADIVDAEDDGRQGKGQLGDDDDGIDHGSCLGSDDIDHRSESSQYDNDDPYRDGREILIDIDAQEQVADHRQKQVVQHHDPAGQEADMGLDGFVDVDISGPGRRIGLDHPGVAVCRNRHQQGGDQQGQRIHASGRRRPDTVVVKDDGRGQIGQAEADQQGDRQGSFQLSLVLKFTHCAPP